jgi:hypothetical protein
MLTPIVLAGGFNLMSPACTVEGTEAARPGLSWQCARFRHLRLGDSQHHPFGFRDRRRMWGVRRPCLAFA